ncbi:MULTISPECIES: TetR/AcrR family transcriptional regulator [unclassified Streptomyces]|uniref:TetR/AcrR family transcriptional regulator n=1 Tax=unclassified Streptomyces TaxID=2593676 RepID=UPI00224F98CB|nr:MULTISPECIES: TetR/AcrR family transcriptional regulator [unclassified Streptomyces]MCX5151693.1 TetR/AcrR family transcriptional regulator [Streptomyces sp. NBC_00320]WSN53073.1 TetR/AcrR family transcriptional regulator [Streptomyces sp. NBC_01296]WSW57418.1 TetR/AcrR family transcriptional regulator [Streptomyces sp. NBC_00998]
MDDAHTVIWNRPERAAKGPAPSRTRAEITSAAIAIADAEGIEALSMRRVAKELGTGTASLYRYLASKDDLLDLMLDAVAAEDGGPPAPTGDWRSDLRALAHRSRATIHRHPWMASLAAGRPSLGPNSLDATEHALAALDPLGFDIDVMITVVNTLQAFVRGYAIGELAQQEAVRRSGVGTQEWMDAYAPYLDKVVKSGRHPLLARVIRDAELPHAADSAERGFELGLERLLDGWDANLPERP